MTWLLYVHTKLLKTAKDLLVSNVLEERKPSVSEMRKNVTTAASLLYTPSQ